METHLRYIKRSDVFATEKAFSTDFPVDHVPHARSTNQEPDIRSVTVTPIVNPEAWDLDVNGFCFLNAETDLTFQAATERREEVQGPYWEQIISLLHERFPGRWRRIEAFDFTVRRRDADFPVKPMGYRTNFVPPATTAHSDYSRNGSYMALNYSFPGQEAAFKDEKFDLLNVWRPLNETDDWPLIVCDHKTVDKNEDILSSDSVRRNMIIEVSLLHHNDAHRWYFLEHHKIKDLLVFRQVDSEGKSPRAFHAAVQRPDSSGALRESVEARFVCFY